MKIYQSLNEFIESPYLELLTLLNAVRYVSVRDRSILVYDDKNMNDIFNEYLEILMHYDFYDEIKKLETVQYIEEEISNFLEKQDLIAKMNFDKMFDLNEEFISVYWEDLYVFKRYDVIADISKNMVVDYHRDIVGQEVSKKSFAYSENYTDMSMYTLFREDKSMMTICTIILEEHDKRELIDFYIVNNKIEERIDYESYLRDQLSA